MKFKTNISGITLMLYMIGWCGFEQDICKQKYLSIEDRKMKMSLIINFGTAIITFVIGLLLILGVIYPGNLDSAKIMFAVVLMIYGVYRFVTSYSKIKQTKLEENRNRINEEREKLLKQ